MDTVEEYFHLMNYRPKVEGMDTMDTGMWENRSPELEVVKKEPDGVVLVRHWTGEASLNSSVVEGACKIGVFKRLTNVCKFRLQL
jgi:hypothetical protein